MATAEAEVRVRIQRPLSHQLPVFNDPSRMKVACCGRRWGKTTMCLMCAIEGHGPLMADGTRKYKGAVDGAVIWWVAPTYSQSTGVWAALKAACAPRGARDRTHPERVIWKSEVERTVHFPGGGQIVVKTADDPDNLRGYGLDGVIFDEAAFMKPETWSEVIRPALLDRGGWAFFISTPKGLNWFYDLFTDAEGRKGWSRWQRPTWDNPLISKEDIEDIRQDPNIGPLTFQQEIEALFVVAGAGMFQPDWFRYYREQEDGLAYILEYGDNREVVPFNSLQRFTTVDLATSLKTSADYTVISTWAATPQRDLLLLDCIRERMEGPFIVPRLLEVWKKWHPAYLGIESAGFQLALIQEATNKGLPTKRLLPEKDKISRALTAQSRMEAGKVWFPRHQDWTRELEEEVLAFPIAEHDDFVDTLAYACRELVGDGLDTSVGPGLIPRVAPWNI